MTKAVTLREIERIFEITDVLGISREALVIPLQTQNPGRVSLVGKDKLQIVVERDADFDEWLKKVEPQIRALMNLPPD